MFFEILSQSLDKITIILAILVFFLMDYRPPWWKTKQAKEKKSKIPGPLSIPILGTRWIFNFGGYELSKIHEFYDEMYKKYGPLMKEEAFFNIPVYNIFEKEDIEKILKAPSKFPVRPPSEALAFYRCSRPDRYASTGLVNEQGEKWYSLRTSLTTSLTSLKTMLNFQNEAYNLAEDWCAYLREERGSNRRIENINDYVVVLCIETTCALVLGRRLGFLSPNSVPQKYIKLAEALQNNFKSLRDTQFSCIPLWKYFPTASYKKMVESENFIYETVLEILNDYVEENTENSVYNSIISANIDGREKTAAIIDFIAAGIHTLKNSLIFLLHLVAENREKQENIVKDLNYAKACMIESFRLLPTATPLARILEQDTEVGGHFLKSGSVVLCHNSIACRNEKNFKFPNDFEPERWLGEEKQNSTFLIAPFGVGRRICPGKRFIEFVLPIFLQQIVKNFDLSTDQKLELEFEFLRAPKEPISMCFKDRY